MDKTIYYENGRQVYPCRCGQMHRGDYGAYDYWHHECFHNAPLCQIDEGYYCCSGCGKDFFTAEVWPGNEQESKKGFSLETSSHEGCVHCKTPAGRPVVPGRWHCQNCGEWQHHTTCPTCGQWALRDAIAANERARRAESTAQGEEERCER